MDTQVPGGERRQTSATRGSMQDEIAVSPSKLQLASVEGGRDGGREEVTLFYFRYSLLSKYRSTNAWELSVWSEVHVCTSGHVLLHDLWIRVCEWLLSQVTDRVSCC